MIVQKPVFNWLSSSTGMDERLEIFMSEKATVFDNKPKKVELVKGEHYFYCACGKSGGQPFCDGSHRGTSFVPKKFSPTQTGTALLCQCKQTHNPPYCDGTHKTVLKLFFVNLFMIKA